MSLIWIILIAFLLFFLWFSPRANTVQSFFEAQSDQGRQPGIVLLTSSLVISWIFAKSITNAANLGLAFGWVGGLSYAVYYLSFVVAGVVIYQLRTKGGFCSLHHFLHSRFGRGAMVLFSILVGFRLFNEVWSNTMVIGSYFGEPGSGSYYGAILLFTGLTLLYTLKGGMSSSILTDAVQMILFGVLLSVILGYLLPAGEFSFQDYLRTGEWKMSAGVDFFLVALIQVFSYPFHDAVLTDRGFLSAPTTTLKSFLWAGLVGFVCIFLFSIVGLQAKLLGLEGQATVEISKLLGVGLMLVMNFIMITSAASTLDSAFTSSAKLLVKDLGTARQQTVRRGRLVMTGFAVLGTLPIFLNPTILSATTISGTMVLGLAPVFLLWKMPTRPLAFHLAVGFAVVTGILLALGLWPDSLVFFSGTYGALLSANILGTMGSFALYWVASIGGPKVVATDTVP